jgi:uncharacterized membrane protein YphA (DoxX/SURF4 family)
LFFGSGVSKLAPSDTQVQSFVHWGYPMWFLYLTGFLEVVGGLSLALASTRFVGSLLLGCVMLGAIATHLAFAEYAMAIVPLVLFGLLVWLASASSRPVLAESPAAQRRRQVEHHGHSV